MTVCRIMSDNCQADVTVTVTEALVLRRLLEDRRRTTESIRILVPGDRMKQQGIQIMTNESVARSSFRCCLNSLISYTGC